MKEATAVENLEKTESKKKSRKSKGLLSKYFESGITKRWIKNTLFVVVAILLFVGAVFLFVIRDYYNSTVDMKLSSQYSNSVATFFSSYTGGSKARFEAGAREYIANFTQKDALEVWVIDGEGNVVISSSGFKIEKQKIPDYEQALKSDTRSGTFRGENRYGERIRSNTYLLPTVNGEEVGAIRYIASAEKVNWQLMKVGILVFLILLIIIVLIVSSGIFFLQTIVKPVNEINEIAKKIAAGDLTARAPPQEYDDELSELCANINHMAEEISSSDKMKNDFVSTVSHEMKTPLTAIKGWGETLLDMGDSDPALTKRGIEVIIGESSRLTGVVEDLLDLSRMMNGRLTLRKERIDILAELDETIFVFKDRSVRDGIELVYNAPDIPAPTEGDPGRIKQVFVNVLDNAFKYTEQGGKINVFAQLTESEDDTKDLLKVFVEDTGCGISEEDLPKVKSKFYKSNISVRGSGIGLAVCDEIVNMHNGTLDIESTLGSGTCVTITFPVDHVEIEEEKSLPQALVEAITEATDTDADSAADIADDDKKNEEIIENSENENLEENDIKDEEENKETENEYGPEAEGEK